MVFGGCSMSEHATVTIAVEKLEKMREIVSECLEIL